MKKETLSEYGSKVSMPCEVEGVPQPNIRWFRNAEPADESR